MKPYTPMPSFYRERFTIAIFCGETLDLHWQDELSDAAYRHTVAPYEIFEREGREYLKARLGDGEFIEIRFDLIQNMPRPTK